MAEPALTEQSDLSERRQRQWRIADIVAIIGLAIFASYYLTANIRFVEIFTA